MRVFTIHILEQILKSNYHFINNALSQVALFKYDSSDNLIFATATPNGLALKFTPYASKIIVEKGISKLYLSSFAALNDGLYSGETIPIPSVEPEIGFKNVRKAKGNFIVETSNDGLYHWEKYLPLKHFRMKLLFLKVMIVLEYQIVQ